MCKTKYKIRVLIIHATWHCLQIHQTISHPFQLWYNDIYTAGLWYIPEVFWTVACSPWDQGHLGRLQVIYIPSVQTKDCVDTNQEMQTTSASQVEVDAELEKKTGVWNLLDCCLISKRKTKAFLCERNIKLYYKNC